MQDFTFASHECISALTWPTSRFASDLISWVHIGTDLMPCFHLGTVVVCRKTTLFYYWLVMCVRSRFASECEIFCLLREIYSRLPTVVSMRLMFTSRWPPIAARWPLPFPRQAARDWLPGTTRTRRQTEVFWRTGSLCTRSWWPLSRTTSKTSAPSLMWATHTAWVSEGS